MTAGALVDVSNLTRTYRRGAHAALADVSFWIRPAEVFGVVGESGSGKSTLARLLVALDRPTSGTVTFAGADLFLLGPKELRRRRPRFQLVFQDSLTSADPRWTARATIEEGFAAAAEAGGPGMDEILRLADLDPAILDRRPHALSGGERQRVALARAMAVDPDLLVLDEALSALDTVTRGAVIDGLLDWRRSRGVTLVLITHDLRLVSAIADRALVLARGRVAAIGGAREVLLSADSIRGAGAAHEQPQMP